MNFDYECIIIGAGVAGMTAAIYLKRSEVNICILEKSAPGGQINKTSAIDNYPGFIGDGPELAMKIFSQVTSLNIPYEYGDVESIKKIEDGFEVLAGNKKLTTKKIILATGRIPNKLGLPKEEELTNKGISWCAICDGPLFKNQDVALVGSGNSALEESIHLSSICNKVIILNRSSEFKGDKYLVEKLKKLSNIDIRFETKIVEIIEKENKLSELKIEKKDELETIKVNGLFIYIGFTPDIRYLKDLDIVTENGYIKTDYKMRTSISGVYACGDCIKKDYYQISTASADGTVAALNVVQELK